MLIALAFCAAAASITAQTVNGEALFTVNRKGDASDLNPGNGICDVSTTSGRQCTLRAAIQEANAFAGADAIRFNISATPRIIAPTSPLPAITERVSINGWSQAGTEVNSLAVGNNAVFRITLDGINAGANANGLELAAESSNVFGLVIQRFSGSGILISGTENQVFGSFIGTNGAGTGARGNGVGVTITGDQNTVGGSFASRRNLISGNLSHGLVISGAEATGNTVSNSYIGTDRNGTARLANGGSGVLVSHTPANIVGIGSIQDRNVISGNVQSGVTFAQVTGGFIVGNLIGTNAAGTQPLGNDFKGINLAQSSGVTIGGNINQLRNIVSANDGDGIMLSGSNNNTLLGNRVGTKADGTGDLGNGESGVVVTGANNTIGGPDAANANLVVGNDLEGVSVFGNAATGNVVRGNTIVGNGSDGIDARRGPTTIRNNTLIGNGGHGVQVVSGAQVRVRENVIFNNVMLGIDLSHFNDPANGVTPNDANDSDVGANGLQNFPVIAFANRDSSTGLTTIQLTLDSANSTTYTLEVFVSDFDASGHGEGQALRGSFDRTTDADGMSTFQVAVAGVAPGQRVTMTATSTTAGNTSEFSAQVVVTGT